MVRIKRIIRKHYVNFWTGFIYYSSTRAVAIYLPSLGFSSLKIVPSSKEVSGKSGEFKTWLVNHSYNWRSFSYLNLSDAKSARNFTVDFNFCPRHLWMTMYASSGYEDWLVADQFHIYNDPSLRLLIGTMWAENVVVYVWYTIL